MSGSNSSKNEEVDWKDEFRKKLGDLGVEMFQGLNSPMKITLKHTFTDVSKIGDGDYKESPMEYHFGIPWCIHIDHRNDHLGVYLFCKKHQIDTPWSIKCAYQLEIIHPSGRTKSKQSETVYQKDYGWGWKEFLKWEEMKKEYLVEDQLTIVAHATIRKVTGIEKD
uniref:MATH domain-containing protein n=1 Tax=Caenorhabditis tropicalis TaxID=1561998 RepID=A0A1I7T5Y6_9PELO